MTQFKLTTPMDETVIRKLKVKDIIYLSGEIYTARDEAHMRALEFLKEGKEMPVNFAGSAVFHCGPIMKKKNASWHLIAAGPTTSARMNSLEPEFIKALKVRAIIGKGGMSLSTLEAMKTEGCVYLAITGGAALVAARGIEDVGGVHWLDLGMPEALWVLQARSFGPLIVAMDSHGSSLFEDVSQEIQKNLPRVKSNLGLK